MRISKIKKFAPSPNTLFIGTDANTGDTYNFLGSYFYLSNNFGSYINIPPSVFAGGDSLYGL